jgi:phytoene dehydrogenase-like protein
MSKQKTAVIIGAGIGGLSAAIVLARAGLQVTVLEKNEKLGGKLNQLQTEGFQFDLGPSIFTLPDYFRPLFEGDGKKLEDYIELRRVDPQWRNFFEDGRVIDLWEDTEAMRAELAKLPVRCGRTRLSQPWLRPFQAVHALLLLARLTHHGLAPYDGWVHSQARTRSVSARHPRVLYQVRWFLR